MPFNSLVFLAFFALVLLLHNLPLRWRTRKLNLLWLSYVFYAAWNPPFVVLLWISTVVDWFIGKALHRAEEKGKRRALLLVSLVVNLGMLSYFKYGTFAVENFAALLAALGVDWSPMTPSIVLPVGISFYTFQTLSYTLDIHARRIKPWDSFLDYALFVTFFPQLVAGPIVRAREFLPQCEAPRRVTLDAFCWGLAMLVIGLFQKIVLADGILAPSVEVVFDGAAAPAFLDSWVGCMGFTGQIFCDFAGYSICAIGVAHCLGFRLPTNFNYPLASVGFVAFWSRWHISLSTWLRDYVFYSLSWRRAGFGRIAFNILFTWSLIGLWHGASWLFVMWGFLMGSFVLAERVVTKAVPASPVWSRPPTVFGLALLQFCAISFSMILFRSSSIERMLALGRSMLLGPGWDGFHVLRTSVALTTATTVAALFLWHWLMRKSSLEELAARCPWPVKAAALVVMLVAIVLMPGQDHAFVYFQF